MNSPKPLITLRQRLLYTNPDAFENAYFFNTFFPIKTLWTFWRHCPSG